MVLRRYLMTTRKSWSSSLSSFLQHSTISFFLGQNILPSTSVPKHPPSILGPKYSPQHLCSQTPSVYSWTKIFFPAPLFQYTLSLFLDQNILPSTSVPKHPQSIPGPKYSPQHLCSQTPSVYVLLMWETKYHIHTKLQAELHSRILWSLNFFRQQMRRKMVLNWLSEFKLFVFSLWINFHL
jgi:hypothetical protein